MHLSQGNVRSLPLLPLPVQTTWSTIPQRTSAHIPSVPFPQLPEPGVISPQCATNPVHTKIPPTLSPAKIQGVNAVSAEGGSHLNDQISSYASQQIQVGTVGEQVTEILNQGSSVSAKVSPPLCENVQENSESVLPGIETLLNAIQVVEGQEDDSSAKNQAACTFTKFTALNSPHSDETRLDLDPPVGGNPLYGHVPSDRVWFLTYLSQFRASLSTGNCLHDWIDLQDPFCLCSKHKSL